MNRAAAAVAFLCAFLTLASGCDCGGTTPNSGDGGTGDGGHGAGDGGGGDATSGNQPPVVIRHATVALYPGDSAPLLVEPMRDAEGDALTCSWSASPTMTGIELPTGCADPEIAVDRGHYEDGPADQTFTLTLNVSDGVNARDLEIQVTVLDERGGDVANTSVWEGIGYIESGARHGFCGAAGRACQSVEDATANLRDRIAGGSNVAPLLRLATTGTSYQRDTTLRLDDDAGNSGVALSLECGFDPTTWDKVSGAWTHTPIRFRSAVGVEITASGVRLEGCDIQGAEQLQVEVTRTAVHVIDAATEIVDNVLVGAPEALLDPPEVAAGLIIEFEDVDTALGSVVRGNTLEGGLALQAVIGTTIKGGVATVTGNRIRAGRSPWSMGLTLDLREGSVERSEVADNPLIAGGPGTTGFGLLWMRGDLWLHDNPLIAGCASGCLGGRYGGLGLMGSAETFSVPLLERNVVHGVIGQFDAVEAVALMLQNSVVSRASEYRGGRAAITRGAAIDADLRSERDLFEGGVAFDRDQADPDDGVATGMTFRSGNIELSDGVVRGAPAATPASPVAIGASVNHDVVLSLSGSRVESGPAVDRAIGVDASNTAIHLTLESSAVVGGDTSSGAGSTSVGLLFSNGLLDWTDASATSGHAASSTGLILVDDGTINIDGGEVRGGDCSDATGNSRGIWMRGDSSLTRLTGLEVRAGNGCRSSTGLLLGGNVQWLFLRDSDVAGGAANLLSAGVFGGDHCRSCRIERNVIAGGGSVEAATPLSVGLRLSGDGTVAALANSTFVVANRIRGGSATISHGLNIAGDAGDDVVVLHNIIDGGGLAATSGAISGAVVLAGDPAVANAQAGMFVGNVINAGVSETSYGFFESCSMTGGLHRAEPHYAFNSAFWPAIDGSGADPTGYVRKAPAADCAAATDVTTIAVVNGLAYYGSSSASRASLDSDPLFAADGYHLQASSPLTDRSLMSDSYWPFTTANPAEPMLDVDGVARPCTGQYDIGVDEVCP